MERAEEYLRKFIDDPDPSKASLSRQLVAGLESWVQLFGDGTTTEPLDFEKEGFPSEIRIEGLGRANVRIDGVWKRRDLKLPTDNCDYQQFERSDPMVYIKKYDLEALREFRQKTGVTQSGLGRYFGVTDGFVNMLENPKYGLRLRWDFALKTAFLFGQDLSKIVKDTQTVEELRAIAKREGL